MKSKKAWVIFTYLYRLVGRAIDLWGDFKEPWKEACAVNEIEEVAAEVVEDYDER